jgi:exopolyphosphatase/guanosine-5'-triphosphate,3'-diphosphate pyrophosphatase
MDWSEPLFAGESRAQRRLRRAACGLANLAWHEHTDYRARQGFEAILRSTDLPVRHAERGFLALTILHRYGSTKQAPEAEAIQSIIPSRLARRARVLGLALRIAYRISGGSGQLLEDARLEVEGTELRLRLPAELDTADGIAGELTGLAKAAGLTTPGTP